MNRLFSIIVILPFCLYLPVLFATANGQTLSAPPSTLSQSIEREIAPGQTHSHDLMMTAGQFVKLEIYFDGQAGEVRVYGADNRVLVNARNRDNPALPIGAALLAQTDGRHRIEVHFPAANRVGKNATGRYRLQFSPPRAATEADRHHLSAQQMVGEAEQLSGKGTAESRRQAMAKFQASLPEWRAANDPRREAEALHSIVIIKRTLSENREALPIAQQVLAMTRAIGYRELEIQALNGLGKVHYSLSEFEQAGEILRQGLDLCRERGDRKTEVSVLINLGVVSATLGATQQSLAYYQQALSIARELGQRDLEATLLANIGVRYLNSGEPRKAVENFQQALEIDRLLGSHDDEAGILHNLAGAWLQLGQYQQALDSENKAVALARVAGNRRIELGGLLLLGQLYQRIGEYPPALKAFEQGLALARQTRARNEEAMALHSLGLWHQARGDLAAAADCFQQAVTIYRALGARSVLPASLTELSAVRLAQGETVAALEQAKEALALSREIGVQRFEVSALLVLGKIHRLRGEWEQGTELLRQALKLSRAINYVSWEKQALEELALLALGEGKYGEAQRQIEQAIRLTESERATVGSRDLRAGFRGKEQALYEAWIESLMRQNTAGQFAARAFEASEQSRARSLVELLNEARVDLRQGLAPELAAREDELRQILAAKSERLARTRAADLNNAQTVALKDEIATLLADYDALQTRIRQSNPRYAALTAPAPLTLGQIQTQALDAGTLLLEYSLGEQRSYLFAVTASSIQSFPLPGRQEIETAARLFYRLTTEQEKPGVFRSAAESRQWIARNHRARAAATAELSRMLLGPVAGLLGKKRLLIVPDGILHYIPFAALSAARSPLIVNHEIITLPSASVLALLRRETAGRAAARKTVAVLADPVFEEHDTRIGARKSAVAQTEQSSSRGTASDIESDSAAALARLPFTRKEAEAIGALAPESERKIALGFDASRALAVSPELAEYRYLHFATHGLLNSESPELSGLAFSLFDDRGEKQNGFLRGLDVYNLRLSAELVTLSGCRTALGKEVRGEGLIGLTRGFLYAGAKRVLAGLWKVDDAATAELMRRFYRELLREKHPNSVSPAAALRAAQVSMLREPRWQSPFYWAAFVLQGEW